MGHFTPLATRLAACSSSSCRLRRDAASRSNRSKRGRRSSSSFNCSSCNKTARLPALPCHLLPTTFLPLPPWAVCASVSLSVYACPLPLVNFCSFVQCALKCRAGSEGKERGKIDERAELPLLCMCNWSFNTAISQLDNASLARNQQVEKAKEEEKRREGAEEGVRRWRHFSISLGAGRAATALQLNNKLQQV